MTDTRHDRRLDALERSSCDLTAEIDRLTGTTAGDRRAALDLRIATRLAAMAIDSFGPLHAAPRAAVAT